MRSVRSGSPVMNEFLDQPIDGAKNFTWREALYLPSWNICAVPPHEVIKRISEFAPKVQMVREFLNLPMLIECWWRPAKYNKIIGGAEESQHMLGGAIDFKCPGKTGDELRNYLLPVLEEFEIRMEDLPGASWVHIDDGPVKSKSFFKP